jgi:hypothetical protein
MHNQSDQRAALNVAATNNTLVDPTNNTITYSLADMCACFKARGGSISESVRRYAVTAEANRLTKSSAVWATSRQPWSIVREWPRFGIFTISVTPGLCLWRL